MTQALVLQIVLLRISGLCVHAEAPEPEAAVHSCQRRILWAKLSKLQLQCFALECLYLVQCVVVCGHSRVVNSGEPDNHWIPDAALQPPTQAMRLNDMRKIKRGMWL